MALNYNIDYLFSSNYPFILSLIRAVFTLFKLVLEYRVSWVSSGLSKIPSKIIKQTAVGER